MPLGINIFKSFYKIKFNIFINKSNSNRRRLRCGKKINACKMNGISFLNTE